MRGGVTPAWTLIIVPPTLTTPSRRVGVKMRWIRMLGMLAVAVASVSWMWMTTDARIAEMISEQLADEQRASLALRDTLQSMRNATLAERIGISPPADMVMPVRAPVTSR